ncbi:ankyrin repeat domain-containing protein, partial [Endozoicomonas sp. SESOKO4]|uniref:ankyrin repeat domain-containing protein n=1 Tax=Endozoicomonas sp. SESOKO4 TaxID=2828745 RepID=UPI00214766F7
MDKGSKQSDSGSQAHNNEKKQGQPGQNYPEPDNKGTDYTHNALSGDVDYYTIRLLQTKYHVSKRQVLANLDRYASEAGLRLACLDCQQSGFLLQELLPHAERHYLTCDQCQQFRPTAGTVQARQIMLQNHTQSQCTHYRGQVLGTPLMDNTLTLFRFMIRLGTEESLLDLLQQFDLPIVAEDLNQTDRNNRTVLHDLAQYTSPAVIRSFLKRFNHAGVSVLQMLLQHASPAAALSWFSLGNPEHQQLLKTLLETNPELSWDELFQQAELLQVRSLRLGWLKKEREKLEASFVGLSAPLSEPLASSSLDPEPSAPPLFVPEVVIEHSVAKDKVKDGETATHAALAARQGHTETVKAQVLLDSDRSQRLRDFHSAARTGNTRLIRELLNFDPSLAKEKANNGETALHKAARNGQTEAIQTLLNFDRSLAKEKHNRGWTALHVAAHNGQTEAIQILLNFDRSLAKEKDDDGNT